MWHRRHFLQNSTLLAMTPVVPAFLTRTTRGAEQQNNGRILVVIQLDGGNDGLNTVVPYQDPEYARHRKDLRLSQRDLIKLSEDVAFHPRLRSASELFEEGRLSVVHAVGYPNPDRSHFASMDIWHTAEMDPEQRQAARGWLGTAVSMAPDSPAPHAFHVGEEELPVALRGRRCAAGTMSRLEDLELTLRDIAAAKQLAAPKTPDEDVRQFVTRSVSDAYISAQQIGEATRSRPDARDYPTSELANRLQLIGRLIKSDAAARVYYTVQPGYDTHASQLARHGNLLGEFSSSLRAFMQDMRAAGLEDRILVLAFSEFGRRVAENASLGTDHGTAGPVFLAGTRLAERFYGASSSLSDLEQGDLKHSVDFRSIYSAILSEWLELPRPATLTGFDMPGLFAS